jgi:hypothetical protein
LLSIISGLLASVATELAVFLLAEGAGCTAGGSLDELLESQEKGLLNFRPVEAGGGAAAGAGAEAGGGGAATAVSVELLDRESLAEGDHGMGGRALAKLERDMVLDVFSGGGLLSMRELAFWRAAYTRPDRARTCLDGRELMLSPRRHQGSHCRESRKTLGTRAAAASHR